VEPVEIVTTVNRLTYHGGIQVRGVPSFVGLDRRILRGIHARADPHYWNRMIQYTYAFLGRVSPPPVAPTVIPVVDTLVPVCLPLFGKSCPGLPLPE
jgi:hypothetical protein